MIGTKFLLNSGICGYFRQKKSDQYLRRFRARQPDETAVSVITLGEVSFGANQCGKKMAAERDKWLELVHVVPVVPMQIEASEIYGAVRAELEPNGTVIGNNASRSPYTLLPPT